MKFHEIVIRVIFGYLFSFLHFPLTDYSSMIVLTRNISFHGHYLGGHWHNVLSNETIAFKLTLDTIKHKCKVILSRSNWLCDRFFLLFC